MKSFCVKTNNSRIINYLLKNFEKISLDNTYISIKKFKHFNNIILHYTGNEELKFSNFLSNTITKTIIDLCEEDIICKDLSLNYFYFNAQEKKKILDNVIALIKDNSALRYDLINNEVYKKICVSHSLYLQAFIDFNLTNYNDFINAQIDLGVNKFLIDKEYIEFVNILKLYVKSETEYTQTDHLHLIYKDKTSTIIDDNKNIINCNENLKKAKYVSDISFSSNDYALNTLLNLVPRKITIHLIDGYTDEFINTLKLIFQDKVQICEDCDICLFYKANPRPVSTDLHF